MLSDSEDAVGLPGKELEKAAAKVASNAGNCIVRGLANIAGAVFAKWIATKQADAEAARMVIETKAQIEHADTLIRHERQRNLDSLDHAEVVRRRLARLGNELIWQQENFEAIALRSIELTEHDLESNQGRKIEVDWIFRFCRFAQDVSDDDIRELWAKILSSASIEGRTKVSPAGLQIMSLIDARTALHFRKFCSVMKNFGFFPGYDLIYKIEPQGIDIRNLEELGLIACDPVSGEYSFSDFLLRVGPVGGARLGLLKTTFSLTGRGEEIAGAVFGKEELSLADNVQQLYLQAIVTKQIAVYFSVVIIFSPLKGGHLPFALQIANRRVPPLFRSRFRRFANSLASGCGRYSNGRRRTTKFFP